MATFQEQFREFLAPRFRLERELGAGGMGTVYYAFDTVLPRSIAIKTLLPERASATAVERFLREARTLAGLEHPNIVRIYDVGRDSDPFTYYIMEYLSGETLAQRLERGPLPLDQVFRVGLDLLAALQAAHAGGVIHRDVKPSNVFLTGGRTILTDFGVAKSLRRDESPLTQPNQGQGTVMYMAPESARGQAVPQSDLYAVGMVLYEAATNRWWQGPRDPANADWRGVPAALRRVLQRALRWATEERWASADEFARALRGASGRWTRRRVLVRWGIPGTVLAAVVLIWELIPPPLDLRIARLRTGPGVPAELGDSFATRISEGLAGFPDFTVAGPVAHSRSRSTVAGAIDTSGGGLRVRVRFSTAAPIGVATPMGDWRSAADVVTDSLLVRLYRSNLLDAQLPVAALPRDPEGLRLFLVAERLFARARWDSAYAAFQYAAAVDTTCGLCYFRHAEVGRFLGIPIEAADSARYRARLRQFPPQYRTLIHAEPLPLAQRLDSLDAVTARAPTFLPGLFRLGDELLHRGPLIGRSRRTAAFDFTRATEARGDFAPAWEHLAWVWIAEGRRGLAAHVLDTLRRVDPNGRNDIRDLLQAAFWWRFLAPEEAAHRTGELLAVASGRAAEPLDAGARYLTYFGAPQGAVWLGAQLEAANYHRPSALLAEALGHLALGRPRQMQEVLQRAHAEYGDPGTDVLALELAAVGLMFDPDNRPEFRSWREVVDGLAALATKVPAGIRWRAEWMAAVLERRYGATPRVLDPSTPGPLRDLLEAYDLALAGDLDQALVRSEALTELSSDQIADPVLRTVLHFLRAEWRERRGDTQLADQDLLWYENSDQHNYPVAEAQSMEVDWAFGTLARWRRIALAPAAVLGCDLERDVARLWADGEAPFAQRADSARRLAARCPEPSG